MKLGGAAAARYFARPEPDRAGALIYGADTMKVALRRQELAAALVGPEGEAEMRLTRIAAADLRKDPALVSDALRAQGFFPGPRAVVVEDATDGLAPVISAALAEWRQGDAALIVTAGQLNARSALRKAFEGHANAYAIGLYDDPPGRDEIEAMLARAGISTPGRDEMAALVAYSRSLGLGDFRQLLDKLALYRMGETGPLTVADIEAVAPSSTEADLDGILDATADGRPADLAPQLRRFESQGGTAVELCIGATRHFRQLHTVASAPGGVSEGIGRLKPPAFGPRRDRLMRQAQSWGMNRLEQALALLIDTDLTLRSASRAPAMALMERCLLRLASLSRR